MRNTISTCLLGIGILFIAVGFITGIAFAEDEYGNFLFSVAIYYWLTGIIVGFFFIGLAEIINLLQKLLDKSIVTALSSPSVELIKHEGYSSNTTSAAPAIGEAETRMEDSETKIKDLTIRINGERFKGQLWITPSDVKVMKKPMFQADSDAQLVTVIRKSDLSPHYERNKDYFVFSYHEGNDNRRLEFKTHNIYDYELIVNLISPKKL